MSSIVLGINHRDGGVHLNQCRGERGRGMGRGGKGERGRGEREKGGGGEKEREREGWVLY